MSTSITILFPINTHAIARLYSLQPLLAAMPYPLPLPPTPIPRSVHSTPHRTTDHLPPLKTPPLTPIPPSPHIFAFKSACNCFSPSISVFVAGHPMPNPSFSLGLGIMWKCTYKKMGQHAVYMKFVSQGGCSETVSTLAPLLWAAAFSVQS
jgi:hypothetical protein